MSTLENAIEAIKKGKSETGRQILEQLLGGDEQNEDIWLWMSIVVDEDDDRETCLLNVLTLNPNNEAAQRGLEALQAGEFSSKSMISELIGEEIADEDDFPQEITFHDQFFAPDEDDELDDELEWPSVMGGSPEPKIKEKKKQAAKKGLNLNPRLILLAVLGLVVCGALGLAAVYNIFLANDGSSSTDEQPGQQAPAGGEDQEATNTPIPEPTLTPTNTPFVLPTARPTDQPSPTPTQVVSPTAATPRDTPTPEAEGG